jgi:hypothetical protein
MYSMIVLQQPPALTRWAQSLVFSVHLLLRLPGISSKVMIRARTNGANAVMGEGDF